MDVYSRDIMRHDADGPVNESWAIELTAALKAVNGIKPRVVHDHGIEFVNRDVAAVIKTHNLIDI